MAWLCLYLFTRQTQKLLPGRAQCPANHLFPSERANPSDPQLLSDLRPTPTVQCEEPYPGEKREKNRWVMEKWSYPVDRWDSPMRMKCSVWSRFLWFLMRMLSYLIIPRNGQADKSRDLKVIGNLCHFTVVYIYAVYIKKLKSWLALKNKVLTKKKGRKKKDLWLMYLRAFSPAYMWVPVYWVISELLVSSSGQTPALQQIRTVTDVHTSATHKEVLQDAHKKTLRLGSTT